VPWMPNCVGTLGLEADPAIAELGPFRVKPVGLGTLPVLVLGVLQD